MKRFVGIRHGITTWSYRYLSEQNNFIPRINVDKAKRKLESIGGPLSELSAPCYLYHSAPNNPMFTAWNSGPVTKN
jgi:hypothetical protein